MKYMMQLPSQKIINKNSHLDLFFSFELAQRGNLGTPNNNIEVAKCMYFYLLNMTEAPTKKKMTGEKKKEQHPTTNNTTKSLPKTP